MKLATRCLAAALLLAGCTGPPSEEEVESGPLALMSLPDFYAFGGAFRSDPYIRAAVRLQRLGREAATKALRELALQEQASGGQRATILCRMLFAKKVGGEFRGPGLGEAMFLDFGKFRECPLEPIEVVDGVPLLVVRGYMLGGLPESSEKYLSYCLAECDWNGFRYTPKTAAEKAKALDKLIRSNKWKELLSDEDRDFLAKQVN